MNIARQSHRLRQRLEDKYRRKVAKRQRSTERSLFYTIDRKHSNGDILQFRRHRHIAVH